MRSAYWADIALDQKKTAVKTGHKKQPTNCMKSFTDNYQ